MTDFFALLHQPRQPWLDLDALKQKYHQLTRARHPDVFAAAGDDADVKFESINEGYRALLDPKWRIQHLLALEGAAPGEPHRPAPVELQDLFLEIGSVAQNSQRWLEEIANAQTNLSRSLLRSRLSRLQDQTKRLLERLNSSYENCLNELQEMNDLWAAQKSEAIAPLSLLHDRLSYLSRWRAQLHELRFKLSVI